MATTLVTLRAETLAARLRDLGIASARQLEDATQQLLATQERFSAILVSQGVLRDQEAGKRIAIQLGSVPQRLDGLAISPILPDTVPASAWYTHRLVPIQEEAGKLLVATDDPLSVFALDFFGRWCGRALEAVLVSEAELNALLSSAGPAAASPTTAAAPPAPPPAAPPPAPPAAASEAKRESLAKQGQAGDEPIIQLVDSMLTEAVRMRASDIHIESSLHQMRVRYRVDGVLREVNSPSKALQGPVVSRIKIMAGMNIAEKRLPQDGRLQLSVDLPAAQRSAGGAAQAGHHPLDVRVSTLPSIHGESLVLRLLDRSHPLRGLPEMGLQPEYQQLWNNLLHRPHGMVLVTGPTGSGKTTTLYGALATLNQPDRKLITVEDPVEYQLSGVNQVLVRPAVGLTFAAGLRAMLRQAPDVIMVGEIRDAETAQIAIQAALTGHLVFSTLHTNDAPSAVTRLIDMGIAPFLVASTLQGILAQRLVRRVCGACRMTDDATPQERAFLGLPEVTQVIRSNGCDKCHGSGFLGRIGLFELLAVSEPVRHLIVARAGATAIRSAAVKDGMRELRQDGIMKIREGLTTMTEVLRVVAEEER